jgi:hypothetical protein
MLVIDHSINMPMNFLRLKTLLTWAMVLFMLLLNATTHV